MGKRGWWQTRSTSSWTRCGTWGTLALLALCGSGWGQPLEEIPPPLDRDPPPQKTKVSFPAADGKETPTIPRCVENAYTMPGQSWTTKLVDGGITLKADSKGAKRFTPLELYDRPLPVASGQSTVVVLDIFDDIEMLMDENMDGTYEPFMMNHGDMVVAHMLGILISGGYQFETLSLDKMEITLVRKKTIKNPQSKIKIIKTRIEKAKSGPYAGMYTDAQVEQALRGWKWGGHTVLNMSFAMVPCDVALQYELARDRAKPLRYNFRWFLYFHKQAWGRVVERPQNTWLLDTFLTGKMPQQFIAVAASGNYGMNDMTWPAQHDQVIGVGALTLGLGGQWKKATFSDRADVNARGEWFKLPLYENGWFNDLQDFCRLGRVCIAKDILSGDRYKDFGYRGTSFSAPTVAVYLALSGGSACRMSTGTGWGTVDSATRDQEFPAPQCP